MFHAVMYLVSLDHNLKYGLTDSPGSLYHGREAFRLINEGLEAGVIRDTLIAAVSIVISREVKLELNIVPPSRVSYVSLLTISSLRISPANLKMLEST